MLNEATGKHHKLTNYSPFMSDWLDLGIVHDRVEFVVIFALNVAEPSRANFEHWWETKTDALNHTNLQYLPNFPTLINGKQYRVKCVAETREGKELLMNGLKDDEFVNANFQIHNHQSGVFDRNLQVTSIICNVNAYQR